MTNRDTDSTMRTRFRFPVPIGGVSARVHGARNQLRELAKSAGEASRTADSRESAASLRGKRAAYLEAERIVAAIERGHRLPRMHRP